MAATFTRILSRQASILRTSSRIAAAHIRSPALPLNIQGRARTLSFTRQPRKMATDDDYMAFLNKANQDTGYSAQEAPKQGFKAMDEGSRAPKEIEHVCAKAVYVSEADEPFESVSLSWTGENGLPDEEQLAALINHPDPSNADISIMDPLEWDSKGQYNDVIDAVRQASKGNDVRVYRVVRDATRVEYWVVTSTEGKLVGAKALGVES